jgi:hypothetical protein
MLIVQDLSQHSRAIREISPEDLDRISGGLAPVERSPEDPYRIGMPVPKGMGRHPNP